MSHPSWARGARTLDVCLLVVCALSALLIATGSWPIHAQSTDARNATTVRGSLGEPEASAICRPPGGHQTPGPRARIPDRGSTRGCVENLGGVAATLLSSLWLDRDIGDAHVAGLSTELDGTIAVAGSGVGFDETSDQFHIAYQTLSVDADIVVRLVDIDGTHPNAVAGVMVRASLNADAEHVSLLATRKDGVRLVRRLSPGWTPQTTSSGVGFEKAWLKLERRGPVVIGYVSTDGSTWTLLGSEQVAFGQTVYVGLAVASHQANALTTALFDEVSLVFSPDSSPQPPSPDLPDPETSTPQPSPEPPSSEEPEPSVPSEPAIPAPATPEPEPSPEPEPTPEPEPVPVPEPVPTPPPSVEPEPSPAPAPPPTAVPKYLVFEPSADHATNVDGYIFEVSSAGPAPLTLLRQDIGNPAVVDGECRIDVSGLLAQLPPGSYIASVKAANGYGASEGATSSVFVRE